MKHWPKFMAAIVLTTALTASAPAAPSTTEPTLNREQQKAAAIVVAHPISAMAAQRIDAFGVVLDPTLLLAELGDTTAATAAQQSAGAELSRLQQLYKGGAGASLKMLETAQAEQAKVLAESQSAAARLTLHWGPVAGMPATARQKLLQASLSGRSVLLRADMPGRHSVGELPNKALLEVDGIRVPGQVLGALRQTTDLQSVGLLVEVPNAPTGLGPGARVPVSLLMAEQSGLSLPRDAILYDENGAYVYKQLTPKPGDQTNRYAPVKVTLLVPYGDGWLVKGVDDDDNIVVHGVGVLWSLQGVDAHAVDGDDD